MFLPELGHIFDILLKTKHQTYRGWFKVPKHKHLVQFQMYSMHLVSTWFSGECRLYIVFTDHVWIGCLKWLRIEV